VSASSSSSIAPTALVFSNLPDRHLVALAQLLGQEPVYFRQRVSKLNFSWATLNELKTIITYVNDHMRGYSSKRLRKAGTAAGPVMFSHHPANLRVGNKPDLIAVLSNLTFNDIGVG
jgi:hypothetical protein